MKKIILFALISLRMCIAHADMEVPVGALLSLSGDAASEGAATRKALLLAEQDINALLSQERAGFHIRLLVEDTQTNPDIALEKAKSLHARGARVLLGPSTSAELHHIKEFAQEQGVLILSHASTAPSLSLAGDNIFRFVPDDTHQAQAIVEIMKERGVTAVVPVWRGDVFGDDLVAGVISRADTMHWAEGVRYDPDEHDPVHVVELLAGQVTALLDTAYTTNHVAVLLVSLVESAFILAEASRVPVLGDVAWFGSDGTARSGAIKNNEKAAAFAAKTSLVSPVHTYDAGRMMLNAPLAAVCARVTYHIGRDPEPYAFAAWDALWVAAAAMQSAGPDAALEVLRQELIDTADQFQGMLGAGSLNEAGDRIFGKYGFYRMEETEQGEYKWVRDATCHIQPVFPPYITRP